MIEVPSSGVSNIHRSGDNAASDILHLLTSDQIGQKIYQIISQLKQYKSKEEKRKLNDELRQLVELASDDLIIKIALNTNYSIIQEEFKKRLEGKRFIAIESIYLIYKTIRERTMRKQDIIDMAIENLVEICKKLSPHEIDEFIKQKERGDRTMICFVEILEEIKSGIFKV